MLKPTSPVVAVAGWQDMRNNGERILGTVLSKHEVIVFHKFT